MSLLLKVLVLCAACAGVGCAVVSFAPVLNAGSPESATWLWPLGFTAPVLGLLLVWIILRMRAHWHGDRRVGASLNQVKAGLLLLALPVFYAVSVATESRLGRERAEVLRKTGFTEWEVRRFGDLPHARGPFEGSGGGEEQVRGKLFVFDAGRLDASPIHFRLPARLEPVSPAEVGTVASVAWVKDSSNDWQRWVRLIDVQSREVVCDRSFPRDDADAQVLRWLESLTQTDRSPG